MLLAAIAERDTDDRRFAAALAGMQLAGDDSPAASTRARVGLEPVRVQPGRLASFGRDIAERARRRGW